MYKQYFKQAWNLMKQNRFFSAVYIVGTGLAISMVMVIAIAVHIRTANIAPEVNRNRMLYASYLHYTEGENKSSFFFGAQVAKECLLPLTTAEAVGVASNPTVTSLMGGDLYAKLPGGDPHKVAVMGTNDGFWRVFRFSFVDGKPFDEAAFQSGLPRIVLSVSLARKLFGRTEVAGQAVNLDDVEYIVSGVVKDVSTVTPSVAADVWVPYTSLPWVMNTGSGERDAAMGFLIGYILPARGVTYEEVENEVNERIKRYNSTLRDGKISLPYGVETHEKYVIYQFTGGGLGTNTGGGGPVSVAYISLVLLVALFLLVPALNLSGLNASHVQDRMAELGVRKAFGARKSGLFMQIFIENMLLMLPGGLVGLLFSYLLVVVFRNVLLAPNVFALLMGEGEASLTPGMMLDPVVFAYAFGVCLVLNILSSMIPVWHAVKVDIIKSINS